jgi:hypothetical protein
MCCFKIILLFVGYLMNSYVERDEGFAQLLAAITLVTDNTTAPCLAEKVKVMLSGRCEGHAVVARGNGCLPGPAMSRKLQRVLGDEVRWLCTIVCFFYFVYCNLVSDNTCG